MKIRKIATVIAGALMVGATMGAASAASYPDQILNKNVAVVYGTDGADATDMTAANSIQTSLATAASGLDMGTTVTGGEEFMIEKSSDNLNLGDGFHDVISSGKIDDDDLDFLADGIYKDSDNDEYDYSQAIYLENLTTTLIVDKDYNDKEPTLGISIDKGDAVLTYNITFDDLVTNVSTMKDSDVMIAGQAYYVLTSDDNSTLELLDTADSTILAEGETVTVGGRTVSIAFIDAGGVKLVVDGETTNELDEGDTYKLDDGSYIAVKELLTSSRETTTQKVEFSIGSGKIILTDGAEVEVNDDTIDDFFVDLAGSGAAGLSGISFRWNVDEDTFLTEDSDAITMPVFGGITLSYDGINFADDQEVTELVSHDDYITLETEIAEGSLTLPIAYKTLDGGNFTGLGEAADAVLDVAGTDGNTFNVTLNESEDTMFVVTYIKGDEGYTYAYQLTSVSENSDDEVVVKLDELAGGSDVELTDIGDDKDVADITLTLVAGNDTLGTATINVATPVNSADVYGNIIVTAAGLEVIIPSSVNTSVDDTLVVEFWEENEDGDIALGDNFNATIDSTNTDGVDVGSTSATTVTLEETTDNDMYVGYVFSDLATMVEMDTSGDTNTFVVTYNGEEVTIDASVIAGGSSTSEGEINAVAVADTASTTGKNLVVVGGNCVNAVARDLLGLTGGDGCLAAFEAETGVGNGGVLIQSFAKGENIALLVAGYSAADTTKAEKALAAASDLDVSVGSKYVLEDTTAADASLVAA